MVTHSSTLAWKIPWMEEPGRLYSTGSQRIRHKWATSLVHWQFVSQVIKSPSYINLLSLQPSNDIRTCFERYQWSCYLLILFLICIGPLIQEKGMTENEMVRWHHQLYGRESEQTPGAGGRRGSLACWAHGIAKIRTRLSDWTEQIVDLQCGVSFRGTAKWISYTYTYIHDFF